MYTNLPTQCHRVLSRVTGADYYHIAGLTCWVISEDPEMDGRELDLKAALEHINGRQIGTILSCVPGKLAYFEGEDEALLLSR